MLSAVLLAALSAYAAPGEIPIQGRLADNAGVPIDGNRLLHFKLYGESSGTTLVWEDDIAVTIDDGAFSVYLGAQKELDLATFSVYPDLWLGVAVDTDPQMDLVPVAYVPKAAWADQAGEAATLEGYQAEDFLPLGWTPAWADLTGKPVWAEDGYSGNTGIDVNGATISLDAAELAGLVAITCYESPSELTEALQGIYAPAFTIGEGIVLGEDGTISLDTDVVDARVATLFGDADTVAAVAEFAATNDLAAINGLTADAETLGDVADWAEANDLDALSDLAEAAGTLGVVADWADQTDLDAVAALAAHEPTLSALVADQLALEALATDQGALTALALHQVALAALAADQAALSALADDQAALSALAGDAAALGALADDQAALTALAGDAAALGALADDQAALAALADDSAALGGLADQAAALTILAQAQASLSALVALEAELAALAADPTLADGDQDTTYSNGTGLTLTGTTFSVNQSYVDGRAAAVAYDSPGELTTALAGQYKPAAYTPTWAEVSGKPAGFSDDVDNDTLYTNGTGLTLTSGQFAVSQSYVDGRAAAVAYDTPGELTTALAGQYRPAAYTPTWAEVSGKPAGFSDDVDNDTAPIAGTGISVSGHTVSINPTTDYVRRRMERYHETCTALALAQGWSFSSVAAVTPGSETAVLTGSAVCNNYVGNNNLANWTCISVPYMYEYYSGNPAGYYGTDGRPTWRDCTTSTGPLPATTGNYPWLNPTNGAGVMMACCIK